MAQVDNNWGKYCISLQDIASLCKVASNHGMILILLLTEQVHVFFVFVFSSHYQQWVGAVLAKKCIALLLDEVNTKGPLNSWSDEMRVHVVLMGV